MMTSVDRFVVFSVGSLKGVVCVLGANIDEISVFDVRFSHFDTKVKYATDQEMDLGHFVENCHFMFKVY